MELAEYLTRFNMSTKNMDLFREYADVSETEMILTAKHLDWMEYSMMLPTTMRIRWFRLYLDKAGLDYMQEGETIRMGKEVFKFILGKWGRYNQFVELDEFERILPLYARYLGQQHAATTLYVWSNAIMVFITTSSSDVEGMVRIRAVDVARTIKWPVLRKLHEVINCLHPCFSVSICSPIGFHCRPLSSAFEVGDLIKLIDKLVTLAMNDG